MKKIKIRGNKPLSGTINISGAKNSVVALIPAAILTDGVVEILNTPRLSDTENLKKIIELLGGKIEFGANFLKIDSSSVINNTIPEELSAKLRASYYFMGALLARFHHVEMHFPGGCKIGSRPIDLHLKGFEALGARVIYEDDKYTIDAEELHGANIYLDFPSVGATVNILLAATLAKGTTIIENAAKEPEIENLIDLLNNMGAKINGGGTDYLIIEGVEHLHSATIATIPDRIEAGTYIMIGSLIGQNLVINNIIPEHLNSLVSYMSEMGIELEIGKNFITVSANKDFKSVDITTGVYPEFPTDLGQPMTALLTQASGISIFKETIYESRNGHYPELIKMGANIDILENTANIKGVSKLHGTEVAASDLRAGAALIIAGLVATGTTVISNIEHILRGYEDIVEKLKYVGANIQIIED